MLDKKLYSEYFFGNKELLKGFLENLESDLKPKFAEGFIKIYERDEDEHGRLVHQLKPFTKMLGHDDLFVNLTNFRSYVKGESNDRKQFEYLKTILPREIDNFFKYVSNLYDEL